MINFDSLPTDKPNRLPEKGTYYATIEKAEMKQPKEATKKPYLNMALALRDKDGKSCGKIFDMISESEADIIRYKIKRFIQALNLPLKSFELKDLCKIIVGKPLIVDITREEKAGQNPKAVVDLFSNEIYYPMSEASTIFGGAPAEDDGIPEFIINEDDAADTAVEDSEEY